VMELINEKKARGNAIVSIVHDDDVRARTADRLIDIARFSAASGGRA
jgi:alpha-D-ribose 1-methylphosphonate 5-triphosphate synthase subunit PhnL